MISCRNTVIATLLHTHFFLPQISRYVQKSLKMSYKNYKSTRLWIIFWYKLHYNNLLPHICPKKFSRIKIYGKQYTNHSKINKITTIALMPIVGPKIWLIYVVREVKVGDLGWTWWNPKREKVKKVWGE